MAKRKAPVYKHVVMVAFVSERPLLDDEVLSYVQEAIGTWRGCKHPDDPIFSVQSDPVVVGIIEPESREDKRKTLTTAYSEMIDSLEESL